MLCWEKMKRYFSLMVTVIFFIPLLTGAKMSSSPAQFEMGDICPKPFSDKKWRFTNPTASMDAGTCVAYISGSGPIPVNDWQSFLGLWDRYDGYTDGAGGAACQRAACRVDVGGDARDFRGSLDEVRAALAVRNAPRAVPAVMPVAPAANAIMPCVR